VAQSALVITDRCLMSHWLREAFRTLPGWAVASVATPSQGAVSAAVARFGVQAVIVDVASCRSRMHWLTWLLGAFTPRPTFVAVSCCTHEPDDLLELMRIGFSGYLLCAGDQNDFAVDLTRVLRGSPIWPVAPLVSLISRGEVQSGSAADGISSNDLTLLRLSARGLRCKEIAPMIGLSPHTVRHRLEALRRRTGSSTLAALAAWAAEQGLLADQALGDEKPGAPERTAAPAGTAGARGAAA
jgi:DNA-binding NarL/FixJ family response regulator